MKELDDQEFDPQEYISEHCDKERHRRCKETYTVLIKKECSCTCDCHVTNEVVVNFD